MRDKYLRPAEEGQGRAPKVEISDPALAKAYADADKQQQQPDAAPATADAPAADAPAADAPKP